MDEIARIRKILRKRNIRVVEELSERSLVVFRDKHKVKVGYIKNPYIHRYGVRTFCVFTDGSDFPWFQSSTDQSALSAELIENIKSDNLEVYKALNIDDMEIKW